MKKKIFEEIKKLIECIGLNVDVNEYIMGLKKKKEDVLSTVNFKEKVNYHKALGHKSRYLIYNLIKRKEMCICELDVILDLAQPTISHHVKILEHANLIEGIKSGKFTHYQIKKEID